MSIQQLFFTGDVAVATDPYWQYVQALIQPGGTEGDTTLNAMVDTADAITWTQSDATYPTLISSFSPYGTYPYAASQALSYYLGKQNTSWPLASGGGAANRSIASFNATQNFTVEYWIYFSNDHNTGGAYGNIFNLFDTVNSKQLMGWIRYDLGMGLRVTYSINNTSSNQNVFPTSQTTDQLAWERFAPVAWTHVAFVRDGSNYKNFVNGRLVWTVPVGSQILGTSANLVGVGTGFPISYYLTDFRVVAGTAVYTSDFTPPSQPLTAISGTRCLINGVNTKIVNLANKPIGLDTNTSSNASYAGFPSYASKPEVAIASTPSLYNQGSLNLNYAGAGGASPFYNYYIFRNVFVSDTKGQTYEGWFYFPENSVNSRLFCLKPARKDPNTIAFSWRAYREDANFIMKYVVGNATILSYNANFQTDTWYHIAVTRTGSTLKLFINGSYASTGSLSAAVYNDFFDLVLGNESTSQSTAECYLDSFRYTSVVRYDENTPFTPAKFPTQGVGTYGQILFPGRAYGQIYPQGGDSQYGNQFQMRFIVPPNVTSVSAVCIGAGGPQGGGGGGLAYGTFSVTPGEVLKLKIGVCNPTAGAISWVYAIDGGNSEILRSDDTLILRGEGGQRGPYRTTDTQIGAGGGYTIGSGVTNSGGGNGGTGAVPDLSWPDGSYYINTGMGAGGAGGYTGNGGNGGIGYNAAYGGASSAGTGGGGSGGGGGAIRDQTDYDFGCGTAYVNWYGGNGGGVMPFGQGTSGGAIGGSTPTSSPADGNVGSQLGAGFYVFGGGVGGASSSASWDENCDISYYVGYRNINISNGTGCIRFVWGPGRYYPNTNVMDIPYQY